MTDYLAITYCCWVVIASESSSQQCDTQGTLQSKPVHSSEFVIVYTHYGVAIVHY